LLAKEGFQVVTASDGDEGLMQAQQVLPDLITLDVMMPGLDGWSLLAALKAEPALADIPVIMLTIADDRNKGFALGASEYLTKPLDRRRLAAILRKYRGRGVCCSALVAEDDEATRRMLRETLEEEGWDVVEARDGREALEAAAARRPDLILLDLLMPEMDGFEFLEELRKEPANRSIPIVVITAKAIAAEDRRRLNGSVERILLKKDSSREALLHQVRDLASTYVR
jgi:adenylate cyclase